ncbi:MAG: hypothetical protein O3A01_08670, partial [bacterium]|nr:hypothetical protein [bacterium]
AFVFPHRLEDISGKPYWKAIVENRLKDKLQVGEWSIISRSIPLPYEQLSSVKATSDATVSGLPAIKVHYQRDMLSTHPFVESYIVVTGNIAYEIVLDMEDESSQSLRIRDSFLSGIRFKTPYRLTTNHFTLALYESKKSDSLASISQHFYGTDIHEDFLAFFNGVTLDDPLPTLVKVPRVAPTRYGPAERTKKVKKSQIEASLDWANRLKG